MLPMRAHTDPLPTAVFRRVVGKASAEYWNTILNPDPANLEAKRVKANWSQPLAEKRKHKRFSLLNTNLNYPLHRKFASFQTLFSLSADADDDDKNNNDNDNNNNDDNKNNSRDNY